MQKEVYKIIVSFLTRNHFMDFKNYCWIPPEFDGKQYHFSDMKINPKIKKVKPLNEDIFLNIEGIDMDEERALYCSKKRKKKQSHDTSKHWINMPSFTQQDKTPVKKLEIIFKSKRQKALFGKKLKRKITENTDSMWFPELSITPPSDYVYTRDYEAKNKYPIYVISKGRWNSRKTANAFDLMNVDYKLVVEYDEYKRYKKAMIKDEVVNPESKLLRLPKDFRGDGKGSIPARNWCWEHSISLGFKRHWIIDDNIQDFYRLHNNRKIPVDNNAIFIAAEEFTDRYENVAFSGFNYMNFADARVGSLQPYTLNSRIYSMTLINNDLLLRWRGKFNEDTDICLRALKSGWNTILFNAFVGDKTATMTQKGGNTDEVYDDQSRKDFAEALKAQHPDCVKVVKRYKGERYHHQVDYKKASIKKELTLKQGLSIPDRVNDFGMYLKDLTVDKSNYRLLPPQHLPFQSELHHSQAS